MKSKLFFLSTMFFAGINLLAQSNKDTMLACNSSFISGKVILDNNTTYTGIIRLGNNDLLWSNFFSSKLANNENSRFIPESVLMTRKNYSETSLRWIVGIPFRDNSIKPYNPYFICDYGVISSIKKDKRNINLQLQNGDTITLIDKTGDFGFDVYVYSGMTDDPVKIKWNRVIKIEFNKSLNYTSGNLGNVLFGEIRSQESSLTGVIDWDEQEKTDADRLNGRNSEGAFKIPFNQIVSIANSNKKGIIKLKSGSSITATANVLELFADYSNDLGYENRGIILSNPSIGKICYKWDQFKEISFAEPLETDLSAINSFPAPKRLSGEIKTKNGNTYKGVFTYNIYKERNTDYLFGNNIHGLNYAIPFWNISRIEPKNEQFTLIYFNNNEKIILGNSPDVTYENDGIIVFDKEPIYISWNSISEININI